MAPASTGVDIQVKIAVLEEKMLTMERDIAAMRGTMVWLNRLLITAIGLAVMNFIIGGGISPV